MVFGSCLIAVANVRPTVRQAVHDAFECVVVIYMDWESVFDKMDTNGANHRYDIGYESSFHRFVRTVYGRYSTHIYKVGQFSCMTTENNKFYDQRKLTSFPDDASNTYDFSSNSNE